MVERVENFYSIRRRCFPVATVWPKNLIDTCSNGAIDYALSLPPQRCFVNAKNDAISSAERSYKF